jgi:hypothetical protein
MAIMSHGTVIIKFNPDKSGSKMMLRTTGQKKINHVKFVLYDTTSPSIEELSI